MTQTKKMPTQRLAIKGDILLQTQAPSNSIESNASSIAPDAWLLIKDGYIEDVLQATDAPPGYEQHDYSGHLVCPGFIDAHIHYPQTVVMASYGAQLLDWLNQYTFPAEARFNDLDRCQQAAQHCVQQLLAHGTTCAAVFPTVHAQSVDAWFEAAAGVGMASICGKVLMDANSPDNLRDDVDTAHTQSVELIERWHLNSRARYALTPRFAPTSTSEQLAMAGRLYQTYPGLYMQTHVAENLDEVRWVQQLYPKSRSYLDVYAQHGLLGPKGIFAHGIWLDDTDRAQMAQAGAALAFCPTSNLFLGSGLIDIDALQRAGVPLALATDVGGGTSMSMLRTMHAAYTVMALKGQKLNAWQGFYMATLGGACALGLNNEVGSLEAGKFADITVLKWAATPLAQQRLDVSKTWHERLFALMMLGDERNTAACYIRGVRLFEQTP